MKLAIHQPNFLPRLKVLQKLSSADLWVILDSVQFAKNEWQSRARLLPYHDHAQAFWLTLPVSRKNGSQTLIQEIEILDARATQERCRKSLHHSFRSSPYWQFVGDYWEEIKPHFLSSKLVDIAVASTVLALQRWGQAPIIKYSSNLETTLKKSALMAEICSLLGAETYLADSGARNYLNECDFTKVAVTWQNWTPPADSIRPGFVWRDISFVSFLALHGPERLSDHLLAGEFCTDNI